MKWDNEKLAAELALKAVQAEQVLERYLPEQMAEVPDSILEAMRYGVQAGGKRLRPVMLMEVCRMYKGQVSKQAEAYAAALEMIHTYSLIHDDLPAMDDDDYRRGRLTTHKVYGEAVGILAGDGLLNYAYQVAAETLTEPGADQQRMAAAMQLLATRPGISGMLGGQVIDIEMEEGKRKVTLDSLYQMYEKKTGALISSALEMGCVLGGGSEDDRKELAEIGRLTGLAFQVQDDILDVIGEEEKLGKPLHSDEKNQKTTCVTLLGLEGARQRVSEWSMEALHRMEQLEAKHPEYDGFLSGLIAYLIHREY